MMGDRPLSITLRRAWGSLSLWEKLQLCYGLLFDSLDGVEELVERIHDMDEDDIATLIAKELGKVGVGVGRATWRPCDP